MQSRRETAPPHSDGAATLARFRRIQRAERNLWLLALFLFVLLAASLFLIDAGTVSLEIATAASPTASSSCSVSMKSRSHCSW